MRTPRSLGGRATLLVGALALMIAIAIGTIVALRPNPAGTTAGADRSEPFTPAQLSGPIIARVNGAPIYLQEAQLRIVGLTTLHGDIEEVMGKDWPEKVLQSLVEDQLLLDEAATAGIVVTKGEVSDALDRVEQMAGTTAAFDAWLEDQGLTIPGLERRIWMQVLSGGVYANVTADAQVQGAELRDYYRTHKDTYVGVDGYSLPFVAVRSSIRDELIKQRQGEAFASWLEQAREQALVEIVDDNWWKEL